MRLLTFHRDGDLHVGLLDGGEVAELAADDLNPLLALTPAEITRLATGTRTAEADVTLGPAVPRPPKIICIGLNYRRHAEEAGMPVPGTPVVFSKFSNTLAGSGEDVPLPPDVAQQYDYEAELGVVIGRTTKNVSEAQALECVWGYTNCNDVSARDLQFLSTQWLLGKTLDRFLPVGPHLVSADEAGDPQAMRIRCTVNGDVRQDSNTADMIFGVAELVSYLSRHFTLEPGDLIATGTPQGVAQGRPDKPWLVPGDEVVVEVGGLGRLTNRMS
ncbi:MAG TPA: fumarylacetoacetate hydrolase family protein [Candidatus Dormibacteraeota bacterium]|nr:fumarylacetoacetate hydrolase family protein [Candidatus Dormibacteraeota bacterium]